MFIAGTLRKLFTQIELKKRKEKRKKERREKEEERICK